MCLSASTCYSLSERLRVRKADAVEMSTVNSGRISIKSTS